MLARCSRVRPSPFSRLFRSCVPTHAAMAHTTSSKTSAAESRALLTPRPDAGGSILPSNIPRVSALYAAGVLSEASETTATAATAAINNRVGLILGDITRLKVGVVVNAANQQLRGGMGVDGAIHAAAGPQLLEECRKFPRNSHGVAIEVGEAVVTGSYRMFCDHVVHTAGPIWGKQSAEMSQSLLRKCYSNSLNCAVQAGCRSVAFPCISTGVYGYPLGRAADVACSEVRRFLEQDDKIDLVVFCVFRSEDLEAYQKSLPKYFPPSPTEQQNDGV